MLAVVVMLDGRQMQRFPVYENDIRMLHAMKSRLEYAS